jgi:hypothetical protein
MNRTFRVSAGRLRSGAANADARASAVWLVAVEACRSCAHQASFACLQADQIKEQRRGAMSYLCGGSRELVHTCGDGGDARGRHDTKRLVLLLTQHESA